MDTQPPQAKPPHDQARAALDAAAHFCFLGLLRTYTRNTAAAVNLILL